MKCTVVLPVYNAGELLRLAIESILTQDQREFEFLIIDDASRDRSPELIREYAAQDSRIRAIFHRQNCGVAKTLNEGLQEARGEFVARMDADDIALPKRLSTQIDFLGQHPDVAVVGTFAYHMGRTVARDRLVTLPVEGEEIANRLQSENCIYHPTVMVRREQILDLGGYRADFLHAEDYELWLRVSKHHRLANIPIPLLRYRFSINGESLAKRPDQALYAKAAQLAFSHPDWTREQLLEEASHLMDVEGRSWFMEQVVRGTMKELIALGWSGQAMRLFWRFLPLVGWRLAIGVIRDLRGEFYQALRGRA